MESTLCPPTEPDFRLIETFGWHPGEGFRRLDRHLARMARSARAFGIPFDLDKAKDVLPALTSQKAQRCRLVLDRNGRFDLTWGDLGVTPKIWRVGLSNEKLNESDPFLRHKTTQRALYDQTRAKLPRGIDEVVFLNGQNHLSEGTITNLFIQTQTGKILTPPLDSGVLPGILREVILEEEQAHEAVLTEQDLHTAHSVFMGNSLRGLIKVEISGHVPQ